MDFLGKEGTVNPSPTLPKAQIREFSFDDIGAGEQPDWFSSSVADPFASYTPTPVVTPTPTISHQPSTRSSQQVPYESAPVQPAQKSYVVSDQDPRWAWSYETNDWIPNPEYQEPAPVQTPATIQSPVYESSPVQPQPVYPAQPAEPAQKSYVVSDQDPRWAWSYETNDWIPNPEYQEQSPAHTPATTRSDQTLTSYHQSIQPSITQQSTSQHYNSYQSAPQVSVYSPVVPQQVSPAPSDTTSTSRRGSQPAASYTPVPVPIVKAPTPVVSAPLPSVTAPRTYAPAVPPQPVVSAPAVNMSQWQVPSVPAAPAPQERSVPTFSDPASTFQSYTSPAAVPETFAASAWDTQPTQFVSDPQPAYDENAYPGWKWNGTEWVAQEQEQPPQPQQPQPQQQQYHQQQQQEQSIQSQYPGWRWDGYQWVADPSTALPTAPAVTRQIEQRAHGPAALGVFTTSGKFLSIFPRAGSFVNITPMAELVGHTAEYEALASHPGPLSSSTSIDTVKSYVDRIISTCSERDERLLWGVLKTMAEEYGDMTKGGKNVASLLMSESRSSVNDVKVSEQPPPIRQAAAAKVQESLVLGNHDAACQAAMEAEMWGMALLIASHMNPEKFKAVSAAMSRSNFAVGSPLRTVYMVYTNSLDEIFGGSRENQDALTARWNESVAALLANRSQSWPQAIARIGDMLRERGNLSASHCCYAIADLAFEKPSYNARYAFMGGPVRMSYLTKSVRLMDLVVYGKVRGNPQAGYPRVIPLQVATGMIMAEYGFTKQATAYLDHVYSSARQTRNNQALLDRIEDIRRAVRNGVEPSVGASFIDGVMSWFKPKQPSPPSVETKKLQTPSGIPAHVRSGSNYSSPPTVPISRDDTPEPSPRGTPTGNGTPETKKTHSRSGSFGFGNILTKVKDSVKSALTRDKVLGEAPEGLFYFDENTKKWRKRGEEEKEEVAPSKPPEGPSVVPMASNPAPVAARSATSRYTVVGKFASGSASVAAPIIPSVIPQPKVNVFIPHAPSNIFIPKAPAQPTPTADSAQPSDQQQSPPEDNTSGGYSPPPPYEPASYEPAAWEPTPYVPASYEPTSYAPPAENNTDASQQQQPAEATENQEPVPYSSEFGGEYSSSFGGYEPYSYQPVASSFNETYNAGEGEGYQQPSSFEAYQAENSYNYSAGEQQPTTETEGYSAPPQPWDAGYVNSGFELSNAGFELSNEPVNSEFQTGNYDPLSYPYQPAEYQTNEYQPVQYETTGFEQSAGYQTGFDSAQAENTAYAEGEQPSARDTNDTSASEDVSAPYTTSSMPALPVSHSEALSPHAQTEPTHESHTHDTDAQHGDSEQSAAFMSTPFSMSESESVFDAPSIAGDSEFSNQHHLYTSSLVTPSSAFSVPSNEFATPLPTEDVVDTETLTFGSASAMPVELSTEPEQPVTDELVTGTAAVEPASDEPSAASEQPVTETETTAVGSRETEDIPLTEDTPPPVAEEDTI